MKGEIGSIEQQKSVHDRLREWYSKYRSIPPHRRIIGGVALSVVTGGLWGASAGLALRGVGSVIAAHAAHEKVISWATKKSEQIKNKHIKKFHRWINENAGRRKFVAGAAAVGFGIGAFMAGSATADLMSISEAQAAPMPEPTLPRSAIDAIASSNPLATASTFEMPSISLNPLDLIEAWSETSTGDKLLSAGEAVLLYDSGLAAFAAKRPPSVQSAIASVGLTLTTAGALVLNLPFTAGLAALEGLLYMVAALRGSGRTGMDGHSD